MQDISVNALHEQSVQEDIKHWAHVTECSSLAFHLGDRRHWKHLSECSAQTFHPRGTSGKDVIRVGPLPKHSVLEDFRHLGYLSEFSTAYIMPKQDFRQSGSLIECFARTSCLRRRGASRIAEWILCKWSAGPMHKKFKSFYDGGKAITGNAWQTIACKGVSECSVRKASVVTR